MLRVPLDKPEPDIASFVEVVRGLKVPRRPPLIELVFDPEVLREISVSYLGHDWAAPDASRAGHASGIQSAPEQFLRNYIDVYYRLGYDYVRILGGINFPGKWRSTDDTAELSRGNRSWVDSSSCPIASWEDFESYPWPDPSSMDLSGYEFVSRNLPDGMGLFVSPIRGPFEISCEVLFGYENLCYLLHDDPELVRAVIDKVGQIIYAACRKLIGLPNLAGIFHADDMGFKSGTLVQPEFLKDYVLPWHKKLADLAHDNHLLYLLHTCGNLEQIMDDLIDVVGIDGRHSFEDEGNSVIEFKRRYGERVTALGGIDIHKICTFSEADLRTHVRRTIEQCAPGGRFVMGTGNSVCNYMPIRNYFAMVEEALNFGR